MNRIIRGSLAFSAVAGISLTAMPASAATASRAHRASSCTAAGDFATCDASGTATRPAEIYVHVTSDPNQKVLVSWDMTCARGDGAGGKSGQFTERTTIRRLMRQPYAHPDYCTVAAGAQLDDGGHVKVWISYRR